MMTIEDALNELLDACGNFALAHWYDPNQDTDEPRRYYCHAEDLVTFNRAVYLARQVSSTPVQQPLLLRRGRCDRLCHNT